MHKRVVILGGGTGGTLSANRLRRHLSKTDVEIVVVDQNDDHVYQPGLLFVPFGLAHMMRLSVLGATNSMSTSISARFRSIVSTSIRTPFASQMERSSAMTCWS